MKIKINKIYRNFDTKENKKIDLELYFKKILSIIFQYHKNKKTIIFLGLANKLKNKQHIFLPEFYWARGLLTNKSSLFKYIKKSTNLNNKIVLQQYFSLNKKPDLLVIFSSKLNNDLLKEASKLKIPVIFLGNDFVTTYNILYQIPFKYNKLKYNKFLINLLYSVFLK